MIIIQDGVWKSECIAAIDMEDCYVHIFPLNCANAVPYAFDTKDETVKAYKQAVQQWKFELGLTEN